MKVLHYIMIWIALGLFSCKEEAFLDAEIQRYDRDGYADLAIDDWLKTNFTDPYNIQVKYRWDASEFSQTRTFVPVEMDKIQPFMEFVQEAVLDVTAEVNGADFVKQHFPKQLMLAGSYYYNVDGSIYAGIAENARKVFLFGVNDFGQGGLDEVKSKVRVIYHELTHILHQKVLYPTEFKTITPGGYTSNWNAVSLQEARDGGFVNAYSKSTPNEDFAEFAAHILVNGAAGFEAIIAAASEDGQAIMRKKMGIVVDYFAQVWDVDIWRWSDALTAKMESMVQEPVVLPDRNLPLYPQLGRGKAFTSLIVDMEAPGQSLEMQDHWDAARTAMVEENDGRRFFNKFSMDFTQNNTVQFVFYYFIADGRWSIPQRLNYSIDPQEDGSYKFEYISSTVSNTPILPALDAFLKEWLEQKAFRFEWAPESGSSEAQARLIPVDDPSGYLQGDLGKVDLSTGDWPFGMRHLYDELGNGSLGRYTTLSFLGDDPGQSAGFQSAWDAAKADVRATNGNRTLTDMALYIGSTFNQAQLVVYYSHTLSSLVPTSRARYTLEFRIDGQGKARINIRSQDANGAALRSALQPFLDQYISNPAGIDIAYGDGDDRGVFTPGDAPDAPARMLLSNFPANENNFPPFN